MSDFPTPYAPKSVSTVVFDADNTVLAQLCGPLDQNIRQLENAFSCKIARRQGRFTIEGEKAQRCADALRALFMRSKQQALSVNDVQLALVEFESQRNPKQALELSPLPNEDSPIYLKTRKHNLQGRTSKQRDYIRTILNHDITFGIGPAGTGKTYLAVACAVDALERDNVERIILTRPAVEAGERLGFLPGDLSQKVDPYLRPLYDALYDLMGFEKVQRLLEKQTIEVAPLAYMRGRTLNNAFIILDEAQNTSPEQMKMFLTRIGFGSKAVVTGDPSQVDLPKHQKSGLAHATKVLQDVKGIGQTRFSSQDVVRHPLVARIVDAYEQAQADES